MKMLTFKLKVVKLYTYVHQLIFLKKKTIRRIFILKIFTRRFYYEDTKDGKEDKLVAQFCNFPFSRRSDFIFQLKFFSHGEWLSTCMQNLSFRRNWKKSGAYHYLFFPSPPSDSLVCIYGGGPLCLKSSQPSLLLARHAEYGGKHKVSE